MNEKGGVRGGGVGRVERFRGWLVEDNGQGFQGWGDDGG